MYLRGGKAASGSASPIIITPSSAAIDADVLRVDWPVLLGGGSSASCSMGELKEGMSSSSDMILLQSALDAAADGLVGGAAVLDARCSQRC